MKRVNKNPRRSDSSLGRYSEHDQSDSRSPIVHPRAFASLSQRPVGLLPWLVVHREYGDAQDGVALAIQLIESEDPQTILNEWWEDMKEMHENGAL